MPINNNILNQKGTPAFYSDIFANRPAFGYAGRVFISTDTGAIYEDTGTSWTLIADAGAGTTGTLQQVTTNGNTTTLGVTIQGLTIGKGAGTIASNTAIGNLALNSNTTGSGITAIGSSALQSNTTGQNNIGVGANSLFANTTGGNNTGLGANTLIANTTASFNTAIGSLAMSLNSTGSNNTAVGYNSLLNNTIGVDNTAIGTNALLSNSNGGSNTAIGIGALFTNSTGSSNTAIGKNALNNNTTASNNTAIGINSLSANTTGTSNVAVGSSALTSNTTGGNNTAIGLNSLTLNTTGTQNTAVGTSSLYANTTANYNTAIGVSALTSNTTGDSNTAVGQSALQTNTTGANNVAIGYGALISNTTASNNTAIGNTSLEQNTTGVNNTAIGSSSLKANTTGQNNTAIGTSSLIANTTGTQNTAIGSSALNLNTTGANNTAIGYNTLAANTTSNNNTAIGFQSLQVTTGTGNTAVGVSTLTTNTTGFQNSALGISALQNNTTGNYNTGIGNNALNLNTTGQLNTTIGYNSGSAITTGSNNTIIGAYAGTTTLASNIVLSDGAGNVRLFSDANGLIGINQAVGSTIGGQLDIHSTQTYALVLNGLSTSNAYTAFSNASVGKWRIGNTYNAGANTFDIYNLGTSSAALSFNSTTNAATFGGTGEFSINNGTNTYVPIITLANNSSGANDYSWGKSVVNDLSLRNDNNNYFAITFQNQGTYANVGLGETAPNCKLDVVGLSNASNTYGIITARNSSNGGISFGASSTSYVWIQGNVFGSGTTPIALNASGGNVLIGTTTDDTINKLQVNGSVKISTASTSGFICNSTNNASFHGFVIQNNGTAVAGMETNANNGEIKIGGYQTTNDFFPVIYSDGVAAMTFGLGASPTITISNLAGTGSRAVLADSTGLLSAPVSDISVKENINTIGYGLNEILKMNPVWFNYNDEYKNYGEGRQNGNIAQEMETIIPEAVFTTPSTGKMGINYDQLHAVYIKAIQELNEKLVRNNIN